MIIRLSIPRSYPFISSLSLFYHSIYRIDDEEYEKEKPDPEHGPVVQDSSCEDQYDGYQRKEQVDPELLSALGSRCSLVPFRHGRHRSNVKITFVPDIRTL